MKKLENKLSTQITQDELYPFITDFSIAIEKLPHRKEHARRYQEVIQQSLHEKLACIHDLCGMEQDHQNPYFDEDDVLAYKLMKRELDLLNSLLDTGDLSLSSHQQNKLVQDTLVPLLEMPSPQVLEALIGPLIKLPSGSEYLINSLEKFEGESARIVYTALAGSTLNRNAWLNKLAAQLNSADSLTVVSIAEGLADLKLTQEEFKSIEAPLCRYKRLEGEEHNWPTIRYHIQKLTGKPDFCP